MNRINLFIFSIFKESYEVYTMGENTNESLGHSQVNRTRLYKDLIFF
jgi:hypothetical protein